MGVVSRNNSQDPSTNARTERIPRAYTASMRVSSVTSWWLCQHAEMVSRLRDLKSGRLASQFRNRPGSNARHRGKTGSELRDLEVADGAVGYHRLAAFRSSTPGPSSWIGYWAIFQSVIVLAMSPALIAGVVSAVKKVENFVTSSDCALAAKMMSLLCSCTCCARK
jgi:hypothetical protein